MITNLPQNQATNNGTGINGINNTGNAIKDNNATKSTNGTKDIAKEVNTSTQI